MIKAWGDFVREDYLYWQRQDKKYLNASTSYYRILVATDTQASASPNR